MKFRRLVMESLISEIDMSYLFKKLSSKLRGIARFFGMIPSVDYLLTKYPKLKNLYADLLFGTGDPNEIERELQIFLSENPSVFDEVKKQVRNNVMDLSINYLKDSLKLMLKITDPNVVPQEKISKMQRVLNIKDEDEFRKAMLDLLENEIKEIESEISSGSSTSDIKKYKYQSNDSDDLGDDDDDEDDYEYDDNDEYIDSDYDEDELR